MFTGLVEEVGTICGIQKNTKSCVLEISASKVLEGTKIGDSIALNGVCLTVTTRKKTSYTVDVMAETMNRSTLGKLKVGDGVNLERAMPADGRFGGHIVSGHIDGTGVICEILPEDNAVWYKVKANSSILRYIVEKGSITIDGISLTVAKITDQDFSVSVIPHTREVTALVHRKVGDAVNLECDIIGKYIEKLLIPKEETKKESRITEAFLKENGF